MATFSAFRASIPLTIGVSFPWIEDMKFFISKPNKSSFSRVGFSYTMYFYFLSCVNGSVYNAVGIRLGSLITL